MNRLSTARIFSPSAGNKITYTQWLNDDGRMEADVTIIIMSPDKYLVVATDTMQHAVLMHMMHALSPTDASNSNRYVTITDVTGMYAQINLQGPNSRDLLSQLTTTNLNNASFPFRHASEIDIGHARAWCARISYG